MMEGVYSPMSGKIYFQNMDITGKETYEIARYGLGRIFQNIKLYNTMTAVENVMVSSHQLASLVRVKKFNNKEKILREKAEELLAYVGLSEIRNEYVKNLAYGKKKFFVLA